MIVTEDGGLTLVNRGFGAFLVNAFLHRQFHATPEEPLKWTPPYPFRLSPARAVAPGRIVKAKRRRQNLLVLTEDGRLFELDNPQE
jgi:hypothetical protein